jgi:phosphotransferase system enzyme I (PtsI)
MKLQGTGIGGAIAVGPVVRMPEPLPEPAAMDRLTDAATEFATVDAALSAVAEDLRVRASHASGAASDVLQAAALMARDPELILDLRARIDAGRTGERAAFEAFAVFERLIAGLPGSMAERATDVRDISQRTIARLRGMAAPGIPDSIEPFILVAADLAPADTALLDPRKVLGLVTSGGGPTSHTAILARSLSIPAVVAVEGALAIAHGDTVILDAAAGTVLVSPSEEQIAEAIDLAGGRAAHRESASKEGLLADGTRVPLLANLGSPEEAGAAIELGAEGVGLFRTEFLFLDSTSAPTVEDQRARYTDLLTRFPDRKVVVRVLDAGSDKPLAFLDGASERNPALGLRGIRALRRNEQILRDQLAALAQAEGETAADLWVMAPMVADAEEAEYFVALAREYGLKTVGVMAEIPSVALLADQVFGTVDFVSIGTNDLAQYAMAADRTLGSVARYQDPWHPALLRLVKMLGDAGAAAGKPVAVCGEAAADPGLAVVLVGLGVTTLSMAPSALADVRAELAQHTMADARALASRVLVARTAADARAAASGASD